MTHAVLVPTRIAAIDVDAYTRSVVSADTVPVDIDNGNVFELLTKSTTTGEGEVWAATKNTGTLTGLWMAYSPEVVTTVSGSNSFRGLDNDPRSFTNVAGKVFDAFKPVIGDIITLSADALDSSTVNTYVVATSSQFKLYWSGSAAAGLTLKYLETTYNSIPSGAISESQRPAAFKFVVSAVS